MAKETVRDELTKAHARDLGAWDELLSLLREKLANQQTHKLGEGSHDLRNGSTKEVGSAPVADPGTSAKSKEGVADSGKSAKFPETPNKKETAALDDKRMRLPSLPKFSGEDTDCLLYTSPSPRDATLSRMPSSA